jgi:hypothetical protein
MKLLLGSGLWIFWHFNEEEQPAAGNGIGPPLGDTHTFDRSIHLSFRPLVAPVPQNPHVREIDAKDGETVSIVPNIHPVEIRIHFSR